MTEETLTIMEVLMVLMSSLGGGGAVADPVEFNETNETEELEEIDTNVVVRQINSMIDRLIGDINRDYSIIQARTSKDRVSSGTPNAENRGTIIITMQNKGQNNISTSDLILLSGTGESTADSECFENTEKISPGQTYECDTGITYPLPTQRVVIQIQHAEEHRTVSRTCQPRTSTDRVC